MDMKKYIAIYAAAIALLAGCKDYSYETWKPDETFSRTGEVSFLATFENLETKAFMDEKGHGTWDGGDQIAVACTDGTLVTFSLDGTGDTKRAIFKGTIPAGKELGGVAVYPASAAVSCEGGSISLKVPGSYKASVSSTYPGVMVAAIGNDWNLSFKQALGFLKLTINNYPAGASKILLSSPDGALSGTFKCAVPDILERGLRPSDATEKGNAELLVGAAGKSVYAFLPVPAADYSVINASFRDAKGQEVISQALSDYSTGVSRAELHDMIVVCEDVMAPPCRINLGGEYYNVGQVSPGVFEGEFEVPASTSFTVELDGEPFGFATSSGAGGLGTITSDASALPVAKIKAAGKSKRSYYVKRALGTLASTAVANNPFTVNLESPGKMHVRIDNSNPAAPRYSIQLVEAPDPAVIFHEDFDLCTLGGDYIAPADGNGQKADTYDGYLPASGTVTQNNGGFTFDYPEDISIRSSGLALCLCRGAPGRLAAMLRIHRWIHDYSCIQQHPGQHRRRDRGRDRPLLHFVHRSGVPHPGERGHVQVGHHHPRRLHSCQPGRSRLPRGIDRAGQLPGGRHHPGTGRRRLLPPFLEQCRHRQARFAHPSGSQRAHERDKVQDRLP